MHPLFNEALAAARRRDLEQEARAYRLAPRRPRRWFGTPRRHSV
jgi:hypothetical protein